MYKRQKKKKKKQNHSHQLLRTALTLTVPISCTTTRLCDHCGTLFNKSKRAYKDERTQVDLRNSIISSLSLSVKCLHKLFVYKQRRSLWTPYFTGAKHESLASGTTDIIVLLEDKRARVIAFCTSLAVCVLHVQTYRHSDTA